MKKRVLFPVCMIIISCLTFVAADCNTCKKSDPNYPDCNPDPPPEYPIDIPFTFYSLSGTSCQWIMLDGDHGNVRHEIEVINSNEELENYITCTNGTYPAIDFSKYTLILARGVEPRGDMPTTANLQQLSINNYIMTINVYPRSIQDVETYWKVSIIVNKIAANSVIELIITNNFQE